MMKSVSMKAKAGSGGKKVRSMTIHRAENGFTTSMDHESGPGMEYTPPIEHVHETCEALCDHVATVFGGPKPNKASVAQVAKGKKAAQESKDTDLRDDE